MMMMNKKNAKSGKILYCIFCFFTTVVPSDKEKAVLSFTQKNVSMNAVNYDDLIGC